jgi:ABC-type antimicrobial peptide transport system permease subunit
MLYLRYIAAELRRRRGRTILTALGLGVGVGLVVMVAALSDGLDDAQSKVLEPLTGVGTDVSVTRPIEVSGSGEDQSFSPGQGPAQGGPPQLSSKEQRQLEKENGGVGLNPSSQGEPGEHFSSDHFMTTDLSFPEREAKDVSKVNGVAAAAGGLTLNAIHVSGTVPDSEPQGFVGPPGAGGGPGGMSIESSAVSGVDTQGKKELGLITPSQVVKGRYLKGNRDQAVLSQTYADQQGLGVGDSVSVGERKFDVVGIAQPPLGGQSSDVYVPLKRLQQLSDRDGRVNVLQVRAASGDQVSAVADDIERTFKGSEATTSEDLADSVSGSVVDAQNLSSKLGTALAIVALAAAVLIASLLTLSSVNKRTREIGTLKALGWTQRLVVRQISGESLAQGALGGVVGAALGVAGAALIGALGLSLEASVAAAQPAGPGPFGQGQVASGSSSVSLDAPVDPAVIALAIALAIVGGLIAGAVGSGRAARLRPAEALRSVE